MSDVASFFVPKKPKRAKVERVQPPPTPTITDAEQQTILERRRARRRRGAAATMLTGPRGLEGALGPVSQTVAGAGSKALLGSSAA